MWRLLPSMLLVVLVGACSPEPRTHELVLLEAGRIRIPRQSISDGRVHFFTCEHKGKNINFLVRTDGKGRIQAHLDACYACYRYQRGFVVEGSNLVCIACRLEYAISEEVWDYSGACAPIGIHSSHEDDERVIEGSVLERAFRYS